MAKQFFLKHTNTNKDFLLQMLFQTKSALSYRGGQACFPVKSPLAREICEKLTEALGFDVYIVGGAIRQMDRQFRWGGQAILDGDKFLMDHSRDFDILIETCPYTTGKKIDQEKVRKFVRSIIYHRTGILFQNVIDCIVLPRYFQQIDLFSNAVKFDGSWVESLNLPFGEDYINTDNRAYQKGAAGRMQLRMLINHSHLRPGNKEWFADESQIVPKELQSHSYYPVYLDKIEQLKLQYGCR